MVEWFALLTRAIVLTSLNIENRNKPFLEIQKKGAQKGLRKWIIRNYDDVRPSLQKQVRVYP